MSDAIEEEVVEETEIVPPPEPDEKSKKKSKSKSKSKSKGKDDAGAKAKTYAARDDPRAMAAIRRAKGAGGLAGFCLTGLAAHLNGELISSVLLRALAGGVAGYMVAWLGAVTLWRGIIRAELHHTVEMVKRARAAAAASQPDGQ